jgi:transposase-like protein
MSEEEVIRDSIPEPEVVAVGRRRRYSGKYKLRILKEADACSEPGEVGALLRREGLYSSNLVRWRRARARGELDGPGSQRQRRERGDGAERRDETERLRREVVRLETRLARAEAIIEAQKKLCELLGLTTERDERG